MAASDVDQGPGGQLRLSCDQLEELSSRTTESIRDFIQYYPAARQDISGLSRELADVQLAAQLLRSNGDSLDGQASALPVNVLGSIRALVQTGIDLVNETAQIVERPDQSSNDRAERLQRVTDSLVDISKRLSTLRVALNLSLDTILFSLSQGNNAGDNPGLPPYPGTEASQTELPPYQSSQILQEVLNLRGRIGDVDDDPLAGRQRPALVDFVSNVREYIERSSASLLPPPIELTRPGSSVGDAASSHSRINAPTIEVAHPAPGRISIQHATKVEISREDVIEIVGFRRKNTDTFAVTSWEPPTRFFDVTGQQVQSISNQLHLNMIFSSDERTWVYEATRDIIETQKYKQSDNNVDYVREKNLRKKGVAQMGEHHSGSSSTARVRHSFRGAKSLAVSRDGSLFALARGNNIFVYDRAAACQSVNSLHVDDIVGAIFMPNGDFLASASREGTILITNPRTGESLAKLDCDTHKKLFFMGVTPDGEVIVSIWGDTVNRWQWAMGDLDTYNISLRRQREGRPLAMSQDCRFLACTNSDGVDVSDLHTGRLLHSIKFQNVGYVTAAAFTVDGTYLALAKGSNIFPTVGLKSNKSHMDIWKLVF